MSEGPSVTIIIVNWNGKADTLECLASLAADRYSNKRVFVVDNGSADGSVSAIQTTYPATIVIETGRNIGFTGGNNVGLRQSLRDGPDYVYLLNNDTVSDPNALTELVLVAERQPAFGILTPLIHYFERPDEPWFAGSRLNLARGEAVHDNSRPPSPDEGVRPVPWASGCAMLIRRALIEQLGGFDERYFLNWEDVDLSLRAVALGPQIGLVPAAKVWHKVGRSFATTWGTGAYYHVRNNLLMVATHAPRRWHATAHVLSHHLSRALSGVARRKPQSIQSAWITVEAIADYFRGRLGRRGAPGASNG